MNARWMMIVGSRNTVFLLSVAQRMVVVFCCVDGDDNDDDICCRGFFVNLKEIVGCSSCDMWFTTTRRRIKLEAGMSKKL